MGDSYNDKPTPNLRFSDVIGIAGFGAIALLCLYLLALLVYHFITGRIPS